MFAEVHKYAGHQFPEEKMALCTENHETTGSLFKSLRLTQAHFCGHKQTEL